MRLLKSSDLSVEIDCWNPIHLFSESAESCSRIYWQPLSINGKLLLRQRFGKRGWPHEDRREQDDCADGLGFKGRLKDLGGCRRKRCLFWPPTGTSQERLS